MENSTDSDPIPLSAGNNADGGSDHTISLICAGNFIVLVLLCAFCGRLKRNRNRPVPATAEAAALSRSEVILHYASNDFVATKLNNLVSRMFCQQSSCLPMSSSMSLDSTSRDLSVNQALAKSWLSNSNISRLITVIPTLRVASLASQPNASTPCRAQNTGHQTETAQTQ